MIYSCFDQKAGLYRYFQDDTQRPINADLPVPRLPRAVERIGVPAIDAARPFPSGAKVAGRGWHARGIVVQCPARGLGGVFEDPLRLTHVLVVGGLLLGGLLLFAPPKRWR